MAERSLKYDALDAFTKAYITAAMWTSLAEDAKRGGEHIDEEYDIEDIAPEALAKMVEVCKDFQTTHAALLTQAYELYPEREWSPQEQAGHDFWLTRNGHGAGFWDRGIGEVGKALTEAARVYGEANMYVGDDDKVYHD